MEKYNEIVTKSLIDFEEIKYVLANNNIKLVNSDEIKESYYLHKNVSLRNANYKKILENCYRLINVRGKIYLVYKSREDSKTIETKIEIINEEECIEFLNHTGYYESFTIEKDVYEYSDGRHNMSVINLLNIGNFLRISQDEASIEELKEILKEFRIPFNEAECEESLEKLVISKNRRYM